MKKRIIGKKEKLPQKSFIQPYTDRVIAAHDKLCRANRKTSLSAIEVGRELEITKKKVNIKKCSWTLYTETVLKDIPNHEIRDCKYLSSRYDKNPLPGLLWLNPTTLQNVFRISKKASPEKVLNNHGIDLIGEDASMDEVRSFQKKVSEMIRLEGAAVKKNGKGKSDLKKANSSSTHSKPIVVLRKELRQLIKAELEKPEDELKPLNSRGLKNWKSLSKAVIAYIKRRTPQTEEE
jgi:hypothetical protein